MTLITSRQNSYIKHLKRLQEDSRYRTEQKLLLIEGKALCQEALDRRIVKNFILKEGKQLNQVFSVTYVNESVLKKLSTLQNSEGFLAEIQCPEPSLLKGLNRILILDGLQNPGNMGTLLRTAIALGFQGAFITESSVDPYHPKVVRASMGACLQLPLRVGSKNELMNYLEEEKLNLYVAEAKGKSISSLTLQEPLALVLGKESSGTTLKNHPKAVSTALPIEQIDSLNVAIAGSLLMYHIREVL